MPTLLIITGPTGVGKTELSLRLAELLGSPIINADSRQIYQEIPIGTAAPTPEEQKRVQHFFVGTHHLQQDYNAGQFERDALALINELFQTHDTLLMSGGSMMYIRAVCQGLDEMPNVTDDLRTNLRAEYTKRGLTWLQQQVQKLDPDYWKVVDQQNPQRLLHALEICMASGLPFSHFRSHTPKERPFRIVKVGLTREREQLYQRINERVTQMMQDGLMQEAKSVIQWRNCNSLQTVGYKEIFQCIDGHISEKQAAELIQLNSRHYAKRQLTWWRADEDIHWINLSQLSLQQAIQAILELL